MAEEPELQAFYAVGIAKAVKGWVPLLIKIQGRKVIDEEVLDEPSPRHVALEQLKIAVVKNFMMRDGKATA